jgi:hypothetical protein
MSGDVSLRHNRVASGQRHLDYFQRETYVYKLCQLIPCLCNAANSTAGRKYGFWSQMAVKGNPQHP